MEEIAQEQKGNFVTRQNKIVQRKTDKHVRRVNYLEKAAKENRDNFIDELKTLKYNTDQYMNNLLMDEASKNREKAQISRFFDADKWIRDELLDKKF